MRLGVIIPCKSFLFGKSRIGDLISSSDRYLLNKFLLCNSLRIINSLNPYKVIIVSACTDVISLAKQLNVLYLKQKSPYTYAAAAEQATTVLVKDCENITVIPIDLPYLNAKAFSLIGNFGKLKEGEVIICSDSQEQGTNVLSFNAKTPITEYRFGPRSYILHCSDFQKKGWEVEKYNYKPFALDLDTQKDYLTFLTTRLGKTWKQQISKKFSNVI